MNLLNSIEDYEELIYDLPNNYLAIEFSTLVSKRFGSSIAEVTGIIFFKKDVKLVVKELIDFRLGLIKTYNYEVHVSGEKQYWYDHQPHPNIASLQSTHPHHKHIHPNIKHNRIPAKNLSFSNENIGFIINEIITNYFNS